MHEYVLVTMQVYRYILLLWYLVYEGGPFYLDVTSRGGHVNGWFVFRGSRFLIDTLVVIAAVALAFAVSSSLYIEPRG